MELRDGYPQFPGKCFFTNSSATDKPVLDTDHFVDGYGRVYICGAYLEEACRKLGWVPPEDRDALAAEVVALRAELDQAQSTIDDLEAVRAAAERIVAKKPEDSAPRLLSDIQG